MADDQELTGPGNEDTAPIEEQAPIEADEADVEELDEQDETPQDETDETAGDTKADVEDYVKVYRIEHRGTEKGKHEPDLGEFDDESYARATVREAIAHGWRVEDGVTADRTKVERFDPYNVDITYSVAVVPAAGAPAGPPVGETQADVAEADPHVGTTTDEHTDE